MNIDDFFRSMLGFPRRQHPQRPLEEPEDDLHRDDFFGDQPNHGGTYFWSFSTPFGGAPDRPFEGSPSDRDLPPFGEAPGRPFEGSPSDGDDMPSGGFHFSEPGDMFRHFDEMFRSFDEAFKSMGIAEFPSRHPGAFPSIEAPPQEGGTLRDRMLKKPDSHLGDSQPDSGVGSPSPVPRQEDRQSSDRELVVPSKRPSVFSRLWQGPWGTPRSVEPREKVDRDLDEQVKAGDLDKILKESDTPSEMQPSTRTSPDGVFRNVSVRTYRSADGKEVERYTRKDGCGNEEHVVTRVIGDQKHTVTTRRDEKGYEEKVESFTNMDEADKPDFNKRWEAPSVGWREHRCEDVLPHKDPTTKSIMKNLFGVSFPGFWQPSKGHS